MHDLLGQILLGILIPLLTIIGTLLGKLIKKAITHIDNKMLQGLAWQAVLWVEQTFKKLDSQDKFNTAYAYIAHKLPGVEAKDIKAAIEAAVKQMNSQIPKAPEPQPKS